MAFQAVPNTIGVNVRGTANGKPVENTFYYKYVTPLIGSAMCALAADFATQIAADWLAQLPANVGITSIFIRDLASEFAEQCEYGFSALVGTASGEALPSLNTVAVARKSGLTGRSARGRIYWLGLSEGQVANSTIDSGVLTAIAAALNGFDAVAVAASLVPVTVSRWADGVKRATGITFPTNPWVVNDVYVDTRRSRKVGS